MYNKSTAVTMQFDKPSRRVLGVCVCKFRGMDAVTLLCPQIIGSKAFAKVTLKYNKALVLKVRKLYNCFSKEYINQNKNQYLFTSREELQLIQIRITLVTEELPDKITHSSI